MTITTLQWSSMTKFKEIKWLIERKKAIFIERHEGWLIYKWKTLYFAYNNLEASPLFFHIRELRDHIEAIG